jgi:hypothetical protein
MRRISLAVAVAAMGAACNPSVEKSSPPSTVEALFDPSQSPPVAPVPNALAMNPTTGLLEVPLPPDASAADREFAAYLDTLNGFPADTPGTTAFGGKLDATTVTLNNVVVWDLTAGQAPVRGVGPATPVYVEPTSGTPASEIVLPPPAGGWTAGHTYAVALVGGGDGLKGANGEAVVGSATWALARSTESLVTCTDLTAADCRPTTDVIPSDVKDPAGKLADQTTKAIQLEAGLRRRLVPLFAALEAAGIPRASVALAWTFRVNDLPVVVFQPSAVPPQVPLPNDLAIDRTTGKVNPPQGPGTSDAEKEFIADYLNTLDGFPANSEATAAIAGPALDPATVNAGTILVSDLTSNAPINPAPAIHYDATAKAILIDPPAGGWTKPHRYLVVVRGGSAGVRGAGGSPLVASDVWALARSKSTLVTCTDLADPTCASTLTLAPLSAAQAVQLEQLRRSFAPVLDGFEARGLPRADVAVVWTFTIMSGAVVTFDPADSVIPFPNDVVRNPATGKVALPTPAGASASQAALIAGLNTLDGFSTTVPIVSENSPTLGALDTGSVDPATLAGAVRLANLTAGGEAPHFLACLGCASSKQANGGPPTGPPQLQIVPTLPLAERSRYGAFITTDLKESGGKNVFPDAAFALVRLEHSLVASGKSTVSELTDAQAQQLEPLRAGLKPLIDGLVAQGIPRTKLALAWAFTTETTETALKQLHAVPTALGDTLKAPAWVSDQTTAVKAQMTAAEIPSTAIGKVFLGAITLPYLLSDSGPFDPSLAPRFRDVPFLLTQPAAAAPSGGYPVVVFAHGVTRSRTDLLPLANALAAGGFTAIAIDEPLHGARTTCVGSKVATGAPSDDFSCADVNTQMCDSASGLCVAKDLASRSACDTSAFPQPQPAPDAFCLSLLQQTCVRPSLSDKATWRCQNGDFKAKSATDPTPAISGWNFFNVQNFFALRDNFREGVVDLAQVAVVVQAGPNTAGSLSQQIVTLGGGALDGSGLHFVGQSLGGIIGSLYTSAASETHRVVLNVPGGELTQLFLNSPDLRPLRGAFLTALAQAGLLPGTPGFDQFFGFAQWILDPADPVNAAPFVVNGPANAALGFAGLPADRVALIQYIDGDQFIPNFATEALIASANRSGVARQVDATKYFTTVPSTTADPHGFLLEPPGTGVVGVTPDVDVTVRAQTQVVKYLTTGTP